VYRRTFHSLEERRTRRGSDRDGNLQVVVSGRTTRVGTRVVARFVESTVRERWVRAVPLAADISVFLHRFPTSAEKDG